MVRHRKRKRESHGQTSADLMRRAIKLVEEGQSIRETATALNISKSTLQRYVGKAKTLGLQNIRLTPNYQSSRIFTGIQEEELADYLLTAASHHHGLTVNSTKVLAFQYAIKNDILFPQNWTVKQQAGDDWFSGFMKRHPRLSIRKPEATSLSRATSFNKTNVEKFFQNLEIVMEKWKFEPASIYNCDETGLMTVHKPPNVIATKNAKQVGQVTSAERGTLVTVMCSVNAQGNAIPPFMIFPRVHFKDYMTKNTPPGTIGVAHPSGWMTAANFEVWMEHFIKHSHSTIENPVLLLLDNHDSHISIPVLDKAKSNGVVMLTFPPHCSHKLQPLDRTVYGPLKKFYGASCNSWLLNNPGKPMSIYEVGEMLGDAYPRAFTPRNIINGFKCTGIYPFDKNVFDEDEFLSSYVTDRPDATTDEQPEGIIGDSGPPPVVVQIAQRQMDTDNHSETGIAHCSNQEPGRLSPISKHFSPEQVRPFPKAGTRKTKGGRKKGKTLILTDTPVKEQLETEHREKEERKRKKSKAVRKVVSSSDSEEEEMAIDEILQDSDDSESTIQNTDAHVGDFVLIKLSSKRVTKHYVGKICREADKFDVLEVQFLVRQPSKTDHAVFCFPEIDDIADVDLDDVVEKLPEPTLVGGTKRTSNQLSFGDLTRFYRLN